MVLLELEVRGLYIAQVIKVVVVGKIIYRLIAWHKVKKTINITESDERKKKIVPNRRN